MFPASYNVDDLEVYEYDEVDDGASLRKSSDNTRIRTYFPESWIFDLDSG